MALNNVPLSGQSLDITRVPINQNFSVIDSAFTKNHGSYNTPAAGLHNFVEMPVQSPVPTTAAGEVGLYCATSSLTGQPELVFAHQMGSSAPVAAQIVEFTSAGWASPGWARLPSGILLKWGQTTGNGLTTVTFPVGAGIPAYTTIFTMQITTSYPNAADGDGFVRLNNFLAPYTQFTVYASHRTTTGAFGPVNFQFLAIGI